MSSSRWLYVQMTLLIGILEFTLLPITWVNVNNSCIQKLKQFEADGEQLKPMQSKGTHADDIHEESGVKRLQSTIPTCDSFMTYRGKSPGITR